MQYKKNYWNSFLPVLALAVALLAFSNANALANHNGNKSASKVDKVGQWTTELKEKLALTDDQAAKVHQILADTKKDIVETHRDKTGNVSEMKKSISDRIQKTKDDIRGVLITDEQKTKFTSLESTIDKRISRLWTGSTASQKPMQSKTAKDKSSS
jgi:exopolysaccharide biosynthesis protein